MLTAPYAAILALIFVVLSVRTLLRRRTLGIGVGDGGDATLIKAAHAAYLLAIAFTNS